MGSMPKDTLYALAGRLASAFFCKKPQSLACQAESLVICCLTGFVFSLFAADHLHLVQKFCATAFSKLEGVASKGGAE